MSSFIFLYISFPSLCAVFLSLSPVNINEEGKDNNYYYLSCFCLCLLLLSIVALAPGQGGNVKTKILYIFFNTGVTNDINAATNDYFH